MATNAQAEVQLLLRFLTNDAKVPLATALPKYNLLRKDGLDNVEAIARTDVSALKPIFDDDKICKQIHNAAKRLMNPRKRTANTSLDASQPPTKQVKKGNDATDTEDQLALPTTDADVDSLAAIHVETNRAPLFLAFAVVLLAYTHPEQPLSSRLSLAQAVTSSGAQSKAKYIGLSDSTAEDEGWAQGQPKLTIMGREIAVMRRHIALSERSQGDTDTDTKDSAASDGTQTQHDSFWGLNLEALKKSNGPLAPGRAGAGPSPPIHTAQTARAYMLKSIDLAQESGDAPQATASTSKSRKLTAFELVTRKERAVASLLKALDLVCQSWSATLSTEELDRRASTWYMKVRPALEAGKAGWGQRGRVPLKDVLDLRKT